jgi:class 3 adenylate cyclase
MANLHRDQASGTILPFGPGAPLAARLQAMAPAGTVLASDALAVSLVARGGGALHSELYHGGEPELGGAVHVLS